MENKTVNTISDFEPKRNNRFIVRFPKEFQIVDWCLQSITKPKLVNGEWELIKIEFNDFIDYSVSDALINMIKFLQSDDKKLVEIYLDILSQSGEVVDEWLITFNQILSVDFGDCNYDNDDIQRPILIFKPIDCILK
jgi:hypothetical protein